MNEKYLIVLSPGLSMQFEVICLMFFSHFLLLPACACACSDIADLRILLSSSLSKERQALAIIHELSEIVQQQKNRIFALAKSVTQCQTVSFLLESCCARSCSMLVASSRLACA